MILNKTTTTKKSPLKYMYGSINSRFISVDKYKRQESEPYNPILISARYLSYCNSKKLSFN